MFCHQCGAKLRESALFCHVCGAAPGAAQENGMSGGPNPPYQPLRRRAGSKGKLALDPWALPAC